MKIRLPQIVVILLFGPISPMPAQPAATTSPEVEAIRQEMQQMRLDYDQRIRALEARLQQVETAAATNAAANGTGLAGTNAAPTMTERGMAFANLQFSEDSAALPEQAESPPQKQPLKDRLQQVLNNYIDFGGYFRSG